MRKMLAFFTALLIIPVMCGCVPLVIGAAAGGLGAYAVSRDTVEGDSDKGFDPLWDSAVNVARQYGEVKEENISTGCIQVISGSRKIWMRLVRLTRATTRVRVSARKYHFPDLDLAQEVFIKVVTGVR